MIKKGLIFGLAGQDGSFMAELLHSKGYLVYGVVRPNTDSSRLYALKKTIPGIIIFNVDIADPNDLVMIMKKVKPDEIYNFAGVSDIIDPYKNIGHTLNINGYIVEQMLYSMQKECPKSKFFQSSSRLVFGDSEGILNEDVHRTGKTPYAAAKITADLAVWDMRDAGLHCCSGVFFNHESERRPDKFFSRRVSKGVAAMALGLTDTITMGNLNAVRDFGYAKDYMEAAWMMLQQDEPKDYVIGTGKLISTGDYLNLAFSMYDIQRECKVIVEDNKRGPEPAQRADITKIKTDLGWEPKTSVPELIKIMVDHDIALLQKQHPHVNTLV